MAKHLSPAEQEIAEKLRHRAYQIVIFDKNLYTVGNSLFHCLSLKFVDEPLPRLALALPRREPPAPAYVQAPARMESVRTQNTSLPNNMMHPQRHANVPSCKGGARTPAQTVVEEPTAASGRAGRGAVATLARGATPPQGLGGPRRATAFRSAASDEEPAEEEEGSRWLGQSMRWNRVSSRRQGLPRQRTSAAAGSSSLPPPPLQASASCETGTSAPICKANCKHMKRSQDDIPTAQIAFII